MQPTTEILENVSKNSKRNKDEVFTRLYRYMLRPDLYYVAYKNLYANEGAATRGVDDDTADGFSEDKVNRIIASLANETYQPKPARRTYIQKSNGKMRPLGIPTFTDKLVQEVLRMVLEAVYEPVFLDCSHGFRPKRSCHTALQAVLRPFNGTKWFVEGDIKGCFDNINHARLVDIINGKIKDARLIKLIWKLLKAGYLENWQYHETLSGAPQGGNASPIFANIYLHELDKFAMKLAEDFDRPRTRRYTEEYQHIRNNMTYVKRKLKNAEGEERSVLVEQLLSLRKQLLKTPSKSQTDKCLHYVRYADDFLIGVRGSREDCQTIKRQLSKFISETLKMELSEEKTLITHSDSKARFLGYDISVRRNAEIRPHGSSKHNQRTLNYKVNLAVPLDDKIMKFLFENKIIQQSIDGEIVPVHRNSLLQCTGLEIVNAYNAELRGICNYYCMASNFYKLNYFAYLMEYSCLKTLCAKHKFRISKFRTKFRDRNGKWCVPYETKQGKKYRYFADYKECKEAKNPSDRIPNIALINKSSRNSFDSRLKAKKCELCGTTDAEHYEIHHVRKLKDLKGKALWERAMIAKRRKTMVLCRNCHKEIHGKRV